MAAVFPDLEGVYGVSRAQECEFAVVRQLARELPEDHAVFHGVMWSGLQAGRQHFGEIDVIVLGPGGDLVLLEVKSGAVRFTGEGVKKRYTNGTKDVSFQLRVQYGGLRQRLQEEGLAPEMTQFLVLPDMDVAEGVVAHPRERIIDRREQRHLARRVLEALPFSPADPQVFRRMRRFLCNVFAVEADPTARVGWLAQSVTYLSEGLALWAPRVSAPGGVCVVQATAGAGKTQLALRLFEEAQARGQTVRYVCFNRPLADHLRRHVEAPPGAIVTFHEMAIAALRADGGEAPDFSSAQVFARAERVFCARDAEAGSFDLLLIDEGQDFAPAWIDALLRQRAPRGRAYVLMDAAQALYRRDADISAADGLRDAVRLTCTDNFRSPRRIVQVINAFALAGGAYGEPVVACCPVDGDLPGFHRWSPQSDPGGMLALESLLGQLRDEGVAPEHIALLSYAGRSRSALLAREQLLGWPLRRFTGQYDAHGKPVWSSGALLAESVHRFKGQAAPVVVVCEVDFETLDDESRHRLFVGMTRAQLRLELVLSERAEAALMGALRGV